MQLFMQNTFSVSCQTLGHLKFFMFLSEKKMNNNKSWIYISFNFRPALQQRLFNKTSVRVIDPFLVSFCFNSATYNPPSLGNVHTFLVLRQLFVKLSWVIITLNKDDNGFDYYGNLSKTRLILATKNSFQWDSFHLKLWVADMVGCRKLDNGFWDAIKKTLLTTPRPSESAPSEKENYFFICNKNYADR